jgi:hypothetical protein
MLVFRKAAGKIKNWTETATGCLTVAALLGCVGILVHSLLDFNLQIPANAALFLVLCAVAAGAWRAVILWSSSRRLKALYNSVCKIMAVQEGT